MRLSKQELKWSKIPYRCKAERVPKERFKEIIKKRTTTTTTGAKDDHSFGNLFTQYQKNFIAGGKVTQFDVDEFQYLYDESGGEWLLKAMRDAYRQGPDKRNLAYVRGVLKGYKERGGPEASDTKGPPITQPFNPKRQQINDLDDLIRKERERLETG